MKNNIRKIVLILVLCFATFTAMFSFKLNVNAAAGYMYDSNMQPIYCSDGFSVTSEGIYGVLSTNWVNGFGTGKDNAVNDFNSPEDMSLYTLPDGSQRLYIVDSSSNKLFVFDGTLTYIESVNKFDINPLKLTEEELKNVKTKSGNENKSVNVFNKISYDEQGNMTCTLSEKDKDGNNILYYPSMLAYYNKNNSLNEQGVELYDAYKLKVKNDNLTVEEFIEYEKSKQPYITGFGLKGVCRKQRPLKENGKNVLDPNENLVMQDVIYLCDSNNAQVILVDADTYDVIQVVYAPSSADYANKFQPTKVDIDSTGRMYIISDGVYEGILFMTYEGNFLRYIGSTVTKLSFWEAFKRNFKTEEQLAQETTIVQTAFRNLYIDEGGFIYTVSGPTLNANKTYNTDAMIKRINQSNNDILKRKGFNVPKGDYMTTKSKEGANSSQFYAITVNEFGVYTVVDTNQNRLFTYDSEGYLLYISGGKGNQTTDIKQPSAICYQGENLLLLDKGNKCVMKYELTEFARKINNAVEAEYNGLSSEASRYWQSVITDNPAYELAYSGVGKKLYEEGRYEEAMSYFKMGNNTKYYSRSYKQYRDGIIKKYFPTVVVAILVVSAGTIAYKSYKKIKNKKLVKGGK